MGNAHAVTGYFFRKDYLAPISLLLTSNDYSTDLIIHIDLRPFRDWGMPWPWNEAFFTQLA
jgi:hypothetical protein